MIWIIGDRGMLGTELRLRAERQGTCYAGTDREVDITNQAALDSFARGKQIDWIINCSGYTAVDKAEDEPNLCARINSDGSGNIARIATNIGAKMVHISTDYVFDGTGTQPYQEHDPVNPVGIYAKTKAKGEAIVRKHCPSSYIIRTAWLYGKYGNNFVFTMLRLMSEQDSVKVVCDQRGTPTWTLDLVEAIFAIIGSGKNEFGTFHYTGGGEASWYEFAVAINNEAYASGIISKYCVVKPINSDQYPTRAQRPAYSVLAIDKIKSVFSIAVLPWQESLHRFITTEVTS